MNKKCIKCGLEKPFSEFYSHSQMADGKLGKCKDCAKEDVKKRRAELMRDPIWLAHERERCRIKSERARQSGKASPRKAESGRRWDNDNPIKKRAQQLCNEAVRSGKLKQPNCCEKCGNGGELEKHHADYSKPLEIIWLCLKCHGQTRYKSDRSLLEQDWNRRSRWNSATCPA